MYGYYRRPDAEEDGRRLVVTLLANPDDRERFERKQFEFLGYVPAHLEPGIGGVDEMRAAVAAFDGGDAPAEPGTGLPHHPEAPTEGARAADALTVTSPTPERVATGRLATTAEALPPQTPPIAEPFIDAPRPEGQMPVAADALVPDEPKHGAEPDRDDFLADVEGVTDAQRDALWKAKYRTPGAIADASDEDLMGVEGVGEATLKKLRAVRRR